MRSEKKKPGLLSRMFTDLSGGKNKPRDRAELVEWLEDLLPLYLPQPYREYLLNEEAASLEGYTLDVLAPGDEEKVLYSFVIKKMLVINPGGADDIYRNWLNFKDQLPSQHLLPFAFDKFRNIMLISLVDGLIYFWDHQSRIEQNKLKNLEERLARFEPEGQAATPAANVSRIFQVSTSFLDFKESSYLRSRFN